MPLKDCQEAFTIKTRGPFGFWVKTDAVTFYGDQWYINMKPPPLRASYRVLHGPSGQKLDFAVTPDDGETVVTWAPEPQ